MKVEIDKKSGFCFGVIKAIKSAEAELENSKSLYCLGDIVHNGKEVQRLEKIGLKSISKMCLMVCSPHSLCYFSILLSSWRWQEELYVL